VGFKGGGAVHPSISGKKRGESWACQDNLFSFGFVHGAGGARGAVLNKKEVDFYNSVICCSPNMPLQMNKNARRFFGFFVVFLARRATPAW